MIIDLGIGWRSVVTLMFQPLYPQGKSPLDRRLNGHQSQSGCSGEEENPCPCLFLHPIPIDLLTAILAPYNGAMIGQLEFSMPRKALLPNG
jgi:hypothetical protein